MLLIRPSRPGVRALGVMEGTVDADFGEYGLEVWEFGSQMGSDPGSLPSESCAASLIFSLFICEMGTNTQTHAHAR